MTTKIDPAARASKLRKWPIVLIVALVCYTLGGFFLLPAIIKSQLIKRLPELTKRQATVEKVKFNPFALSLTIDGLALKETNGDVFSSFSELYVNFQMSSIFKRSFVFDEITLRDPFAQVIYEKDGTFNFSNLLTNSPSTPPTNPPASPEPPRLIVYRLQITNGAVAFTDLTRRAPFKLRYQPITLGLSNFTTLRDQPTVYEASAAGDKGDTFAWNGTIIVNPLQSDGVFKLNGLKLHTYTPYSADYTSADIVDGQIDAGLEYRYDSKTNALDLTVSNAFVDLSHFQVRPPNNGDPVVSVTNLSIKQVFASLARRTAEVGRISSGGGSVYVRRNKDGTINLLSYLLPPPTNAAPSKPVSATNAPASPPWSAKIDEIAFSNYSFKIDDQVPAKPSLITIDPLAFTVKNVSLASNAPVDLALSLRIQEAGLIGVAGSATLIPPSADLQLGVTNVDPRMVQPYLDGIVNAVVTSGGVNLDGRAKYSTGEPMVGFTGALGVTNFGVAAQDGASNLVHWDSLNITGINVAVKPDKIHADKIALSGYTVDAVISPEGQMNLATIVPPGPSNAAPAAPAGAAKPPPATPPDFSLGEFEFDHMAIHFSDHSIKPECAMALTDIAGFVKDIETRNEKPSPFDVKGKTGPSSGFEFSGSMNPIPQYLHVDAAILMSNTGLTDFSPYSEKYVGRPLQKGKLSLNLNYKIDHNALSASNHILIDQLTLGPKNDSTNATKMPVKLAVALLKDKDGKIEIDMPIGGKLDDPKFSIWPEVMHFFGTLMLKIATSPFSMLGSVLGGGGGDELSYVTFDPGQSTIPDAETNKLNKLVTALNARPALSVEIAGAVDPAADRVPLAQAKLDGGIKSLYLQQLEAAGKPAADAGAVLVSPLDYDRLLPVAYSNAFGAAYQPGATNAGAASTEIFTPTDQNGSQPLKKKKKEKEAAPAASDLDNMRAQLLQKTPVTDNDLVELMKARANQVDTYLLNVGKISADRLFLTAPKPPGESTNAAPRVNLHLD